MSKQSNNKFEQEVTQIEEGLEEYDTDWLHNRDWEDWDDCCTDNGEFSCRCLTCWIVFGDKIFCHWCR